jgi:hypothetical protein
MRRQRGRIGLTAGVLVMVLASGALAEVVTEQSASIVVFPKVIADGTRDTIIQITNTSNSMVYAHCFYVNAALACTEVDFDIVLTKQQPTYWLVSEGRLVNPLDPPCNRGTDGLMCPNTGIDPGRVPPVVEDFQGELMCIEVDASGTPLSGNHLKGEATLYTYDNCVDGTCLLSGDTCSGTADCPGDKVEVAKYNGLGVLGNENNDGLGPLCLGGEATADCPNGAEYNACPQTWILNHLAEGAEDPVAGEGSEVSTDIAVVPCQQNFETQQPATVTLQFAITNEYEQTFSASTSVQCWAELNLASINEVFTRDFVGTDFLQTRIRPSALTANGFMIVADEVHVSSDGTATTAAENLDVEGERPGPDLIVIPSEQLPALP